MKKYLYLSLFCFVATFCQAQTTQTDTSPTLLGTTDKGFATRLVQFLVNYPDAVWEGTLSDTVNVTFDLNSAGELYNLKIVKEIGESCGEEVKKVLTTMLPDWESDYATKEKRSVAMSIVFDKATAAQFTSNSVKTEMLAFMQKAKKIEAQRLPRGIEVRPSFGDGSRDAALKYCLHTLKYPASAREHKIEGRVVASFFVEIDGSLGELKLLKDIGEGCGDELLRVLKTMPNWIPGTINGVPTRMPMTIPISLKLAE